MTEPHSEISFGANHRVHDNEFATIAARDAETWADADIGKWYAVASPLSYWMLLSQSGGVGRFLLMALPDGLATGTELDTGEDHPTEGRLYMQSFSGTSGASDGNTVLTSSADWQNIHRCSGSIDDHLGNRWMGTSSISNTQYAALRVISADLNLYHSGNFNSKPYAFTLTYSKT